jgi:PIN domain nuclease of toxin-antitoxin system
VGSVAVIVLDTHIWLHWVIEGETTIPASAANAIGSVDKVAVSAVSGWEVAILQRRGRIELPIETTEWLEKALYPAGIMCLPIMWAIGTLAARLPEHHRDPADRIIIATALVHDADLVGLDEAFPRYGTRCCAAG